MELFWWLLTIVLFAIGLIGTVVPVLPGTAIILAAAIIHRVMLGPDKSIGWYTIIVLVVLTLASYALDVLAGYFGAKYFGATKWGTFGAILGALVGLFLGLIGLFVGPVIGAVVGEVIAWRDFGSISRIVLGPDWAVRWSGDWRSRRRSHRGQTND